MKSIKDFLSKPLNIILFITCAVIIVYFGILIAKEILPKSSNEKQMECLKFGSDFARRRCLLIVGNE